MYFNGIKITTSTKWSVLGIDTLVASPPAIFVHVCSAAQSAKELDEVEYRLEGVMIDKYSVTAMTQQTEKIILLSVRCRAYTYHKPVAKGSWCGILTVN